MTGRRNADDGSAQSEIGDEWGIAEERERLAAIVEASHDSIIGWTLQGIITSWNPASERLYGYSALEAIGRHILMLVPPDKVENWFARVADMKRGEVFVQYPSVRLRRDGTRLDVSMTVNPVRDRTGATVGFATITRDITAQRRAEERAQLLAREVDHRANNLLAAVQAIVRLTAASDLAVYKREVEGRIGAMAKAHKLIAESNWEAADVERLLSQELSAYGIGDNNRVQLAGPRLSISPKLGQGLALVIHELATNAAKYGALSAPSGRVRVQWSQPTSGTVAIEWRESGGPTIRPPSRRGFGTSLIEAVVANDFKGELTFEWPEEGLVCAITIPPSELDAPEGLR